MTRKYRTAVRRRGAILCEKPVAVKIRVTLAGRPATLYAPSAMRPMFAKRDEKSTKIEGQSFANVRTHSRASAAAIGGLSCQFPPTIAKTLLDALILADRVSL
jgi:hypothetical protein